MLCILQRCLVSLFARQASAFLLEIELRILIRHAPTKQLLDHGRQIVESLARGPLMRFESPVCKSLNRDPKRSRCEGLVEQELRLKITHRNNNLWSAGASDISGRRCHPFALSQEGPEHSYALLQPPLDLMRDATAPCLSCHGL